MFVEALAYADMAGIINLGKNQVQAEKVGHTLLDMIGRGIFEFIAFASVTVLWFRTTGEAQSVSTIQRNTTMVVVLPRLLVGTSCLLIFASVWEAGDALLHPETLLEYRKTSWVYRFHLLVEGLAWGIHGGTVIAIIVTTAKTIERLSAFPQSGRLTRGALFGKPLLPMILCALCYLTRSLWLFVRLARLLHSGTFRPYNYDWWILFVWLPTLLPAAMVLYSARKRDASAHEHDTEGSAPCFSGLPTPVPPIEAFMSFRQVSNGDEMLFSPIFPRCMTREDSDDLSVGEYARLGDEPDGDTVPTS